MRMQSKVSKFSECSVTRYGCSYRGEHSKQQWTSLQQQTVWVSRAGVAYKKQKDAPLAAAAPFRGQWEELQGLVDQQAP